MAAMVTFGAGARDDGSPGTNNPYTTIVSRNVFGLQPSPKVGSPTPIAPDLPKIALTGTTSILGPREALFKVTAQSSSGQITGNKSYLLKEGEAQDGIEVTRVDEGAGVVYFDNHGTAQQIRLGAKDDSAGSVSEGFHHPFD